MENRWTLVLDFDYDVHSMALSPNKDILILYGKTGSTALLIRINTEDASLFVKSASLNIKIGAS